MVLKYPGSLHCHTHFSNFRLRDSIIKETQLIDKALEMEHKCVAITDHETTSSFIRVERYYDKIKKNNPDFKVLRGNEIYLCRNGLTAQNFNKEIDKYYHFLLIAKDLTGAKQLMELSTRAWMRMFVERRMQRVPTYYSDIFDIIGQNPGHIIGSTACLGGALGTQLLRAKANNDSELYEKIKYWCQQLNNLFGEGNFYLEMQPSKDKEQIYVNKKIIELSEELGIPFIITNDAHYLRPEDRPIHKAYLNSKEGDREVDSFYQTTYLMNDEEVHKYMDDVIGEENVLKAYENIQDILDKCEDYSLLKPLNIPRLNWKESHTTEEERIEWSKKIPFLEKFLCSEYSEDKRLADIIIDRIKNDNEFHNEETYKEINECLEDTWISSEVNGSRWSAYFLNLQNIIDICWDSNTLVGAGRGSGVGFILLYILGITQINPLKEKTKTYKWRFLNPERVSVLDVDVDIEGGRRTEVLHNFRKVYGDDRVANVLTLGTETAKAAIQTAARGLGIDNDTAQYLSGMIVSDRGQTRTLSQTFYGDEENDMAPNTTFRKEMLENYPELWKVAQAIEGLICRVGIHAGGVIFVDEPFYETTALMRSPKGEIITQFDLHDAEDASLIKYDILSVEALDKIHNCLELLKADGRIEGDTLKEMYENTIGVYKLERDAPEMWQMCWNHEVMSLFQMEKQSGIAGIAALKPNSVDELAVLNSVIRLMAQEKGAEMPLQKLARFKKNPKCWDAELAQYGLGQKEKEILMPILELSYGLCISQEQFMQLVQLPELGGFNLTWADKLRKSIAKKNPAAYEELTKEYFKTVKEKGLDYEFCSYVWNILIAMSRGYGFNASHTLAYSIIGLQELNLAYRFPILYWNCANLISDSGGIENEEEEYEEQEFVYESVGDDSIIDFSDDSDNDESEDKINDTKNKKKTKTANFGKIATAIGKMKAQGIKISHPNINESSYTFTPDLETNSIRYGMSGMTRIGEDIIKNIIASRPYTGIEDFLSKVKVNKPQMVNLIKSGAFDELCGDRIETMKEYISIACDKKKRVTLQNMKMLIDFGLIPEEYNFDCKVYNFNKYLKKFKYDDYYLIDNNAYRFLSENFGIDDLYTSEVDGYDFMIKQYIWDRHYEATKNNLRPYVQKNADRLLEEINNRLFQEMWDKYCKGSISQWEMDSISCYLHPHELEGINLSSFGVVDYFELPDQPILDRNIFIKGQKVPLWKIFRIAGTILDKDKNKGIITLLTTSGVVTVKIFGAVFNQYDRQISERRPDGTKKIIEKGWLQRGNKIIVTGIKKDDIFIAKKYSRTPYHLVELIEQIDGNEIITRGERLEEIIND